MLLELEHHFLSGPPSVEVGSYKISLLVGLGGSGKTQTALKFIQEAQNQWVFISFRISLYEI